MRINESVIVSVDIRDNGDNPVMVIGKQIKGRVDIINALEEEEVVALWNKLTGKEVEKED